MKTGTTRLLTVLFAAALLLILFTTLASASMAPTFDTFDPNTPSQNVITEDRIMTGGLLLSGHGQSSNQPENGGKISIEIIRDDRNADNGGDILIDDSVFPDAAFQSYVRSHIDLDGSGSLSVQERDAVTEINVWYGNSAVHDYTCLALFPNLKTLRCRLTNGRVFLDVSANPLLEVLETDFCTITALDLTHNPALKRLTLLGASLTTLDLSGCPALEELLVDGPLEALDVSANENLVLLACCGVTMPTITFGNNAALEILELDGSTFEVFPDLKALPNLTDLRCDGCGLSVLDLSGNPKLSILSCTGNNFDTLDLSGCPLLTELAKNGERYDYLDENDNGIASDYFGTEDYTGFLHVDFGVDLITEAREENPAQQEPPAGPQNDQTDDGSDASNLCKWDEKDHGNSFLGRLTKFIHSVLYFFAHLFGRR